MTYNKPTIEVLGEATRIIQGQKNMSSTDSFPPVTGTVIAPAYELDE